MFSTREGSIWALQAVDMDFWPVLTYPPTSEIFDIGLAKLIYYLLELQHWTSNV